MMTAAERAAEVLAPIVHKAHSEKFWPDRPLVPWDECQDSYRERLQFNADVAVAALMADPDLLVDLAIEAGGLEQVNYVGGAVETVVLDEALYRRNP